MFDKNAFKDSFRFWIDRNPGATKDDALAFCQNEIPVQHFSNFSWLVEQSLQWFEWTKKSSDQNIGNDSFH